MVTETDKLINVLYAGNTYIGPVDRAEQKSN